MCGKLKKEEEEEEVTIPYDKVTANRWFLIPAQISVKVFVALNDREEADEVVVKKNDCTISLANTK